MTKEGSGNNYGVVGPVTIQAGGTASFGPYSRAKTINIGSQFESSAKIEALLDEIEALPAEFGNALGEYASSIRREANKPNGNREVVKASMKSIAHRCGELIASAGNAAESLRKIENLVRECARLWS